MKELNAGLMDDTAYDWAEVAPAPLSMLTMWASGGGNEYELHASRNGPQVQPSLRCHSAPARTLAPVHGDQPPASAERERRPGEVALPRRQLKNGKNVPVGTFLKTKFLKIRSRRPGSS